MFNVNMLGSSVSNQTSKKKKIMFKICMETKKCLQHKIELQCCQFGGYYRRKNIASAVCYTNCLLWCSSIIFENKASIKINEY